MSSDPNDHDHNHRHLYAHSVDGAPSSVSAAATATAAVGAGGDAGGGGGSEKMEVEVAQPSDQDHMVEGIDAATPMMSVTSNQLTLLFQGEVYVFDSVTPEKVQAVLLLLGGCEVPTGIGGMPLSSQQDDRGYEDILRRTNIPAKRIASLIRFREKRKERNFDKKIRYNVRKEVALRMQRHKGMFAGKAIPQHGAFASSSCDPLQSSITQEDPPGESKCQNCGISEKNTPAMRRGPAGPRSLCNACGLMWANKGTLRSLSKAKVTIGPANPNEFGEAVDSQLAVENKAPVHTLDHNTTVLAAELGGEGIPVSVQHAGNEEDYKTEL